ncbi:espin-like protein [Genypterus blacodes]|uniref:espin-like protein n=1 Tax=Genypterus blacodes TaxID=154954 RepID=UPI003F76E3CD
MTPSLSIKKHNSGSIQHVQVASSVVTSFHHLKPPERDLSLVSHMKSIKSLRHAGFTAVFTGQTKLDSELDELDEIPSVDIILADIDSLVPTHDESGHPIAEWKRQVMVRQLHIRLQDEEERRRQDMTNGYLPMDGWKYSKAHDAVLGPFGELLTEEDLMYLQHQIESVSLQKRCQAYELELTRLTEQLRGILPDPIVSISLNKEFLQRTDEEECEEGCLIWFSRVSEIVKNMSILVANLTNTQAGRERMEDMMEGMMELKGVRDSLGAELGLSLGQQGQGVVPGNGEVSSGCRIPHIGMASAFSQRLESSSYSRAQREKVEREIQQSGVSVRSLRSNFEGKIGVIYPFAGIVNNSQIRDVTGGQGLKSQIVVGAPEVVNGSIVTTGLSCDVSHPDDPKPPVMESTSLRKERIVVLFLSHWKKSAYAISMRAARARQGQEAAMVRANVTSLASTQPLQRITSMFQFCQQRCAVDKMLCSWRKKLQQTSCLSMQAAPARVTYSPEQFLSGVDGAQVSYDSLTLDLFMLGYFHILEQELSPEERKMRHLLCFEVFDHVGSVPWETVRDFHKAVLQEICTGRRQWSDGFDDMKESFFRDSKPRRCPSLSSSSSSSLLPVTSLVPQVIVQTVTPDETGTDTDFSLCNNEDICKYIDRSFAFWKEKEAELFDFQR